jgi:hypothetical protein
LIQEAQEAQGAQDHQLLGVDNDTADGDADKTSNRSAEADPTCRSTGGGVMMMMMMMIIIINIISHPYLGA